MAGFTDGEIQFVQRYTNTNSPRIETGRQTHEETDLTSLTVSYGFGQRTRLEVQLSQNLRYIESAPNAYDWSDQNFLHYLVSERLDLAAGFGVGYTKVDPGIDMSYTRPLVRVGWRPTDKLSFDVHGGTEQRHFRSAGAANLNSPTYGAGAYYQPFLYTTLSLAAERAVSVSYFADQVNDNRSWTAGLNQRLLQRLNFNASASHTSTRYLPVGSSIVTSREDTSDSYNLRLGTAFLRRGSIGVVYQHTKNSSTVTGYSFTSKQIGLEIAYSY